MYIHISTSYTLFYLLQVFTVYNTNNSHTRHLHQFLLYYIYCRYLQYIVQTIYILYIFNESLLYFIYCRYLHYISPTIYILCNHIRLSYTPIYLLQLFTLYIPNNSHTVHSHQSFLYSYLFIVAIYSIYHQQFTYCTITLVSPILLVIYCSYLHYISTIYIEWNFGLRA